MKSGKVFKVDHIKIVVLPNVYLWKKNHKLYFISSFNDRIMRKDTKSKKIFQIQILLRLLLFPQSSSVTAEEFAANMSREAVVKTVVATYEKLKNEWSKKNRNLEICGKFLSDIKVSHCEIGKEVKC